MPTCSSIDEQIKIQAKRKEDEKRRERMREAMERTRMLQEEEHLRSYIKRMKKIEMVKESSARYAMKREEDRLRSIRPAALVGV